MSDSLFDDSSVTRTFGGLLNSASASMVKNFYPGNQIGLENGWNIIHFKHFLVFYALWTTHVELVTYISFSKRNLCALSLHSQDAAVSQGFR